MRAPNWLLALLVLVLVGLVVYAYFTTQLPLGLSSTVHPPGSAPAPSTGAVTNPAAVAPGARVASGQTLTLGAVSLGILGVQRQELALNAGKGPTTTFTVVMVAIQNGGRDPLTLDANEFHLQDERGRTYAVDMEASQLAAQNAKRRAPFEAPVPPGGQLQTTLAFETAPDAGAMTLRVNVGYGEIDLPR